jgi:hypothetical protein
MHISDFKYFKGTVKENGYVAIPDLKRDRPSVGQFIKMANLDIVLTRPTAFLYVDGFLVSQSDNGMREPVKVSKAAILKSGTSYIAHEWVYTFKNKEHLKHVNMITSTCASGVQAIWEAEALLESGMVEEVIVIGAERTTDATLSLFSELRIPVTCGDGFAYMRLCRGYGIHDPVWKYTYQQNPFYFPKEVLDTLKPEYPVDYVKLHGTGTPSNTEGESGLAAIATPITYKQDIGHTQGVSALLETCMVLDDPEIMGKILVTANGLGGFYGSFLVVK